MAAAVLLSSCVKDTLYDTPHPDYGKIAVTADWSARGEGIDIPTTWTVTMGDYTGTETSATHTPDHLFAPGSYTLAVWNPAEGITVNGTTATIAAATGNRAGTDAFVNNAPGWFFTYTKQVSIEKDKDYPLTAAMKQQVRELTLVVEPTGDAADAGVWLVHTHILDVVQLAEDAELRELRDARKKHKTEQWLAIFQGTVEIAHRIAQNIEFFLLMSHIQQRCIIFIDEHHSLLASLCSNCSYQVEQTNVWGWRITIHSKPILIFLQYI